MNPLHFFHFLKIKAILKFCRQFKWKLFILNAKDYSIKKNINLNCGKIRKQFILKNHIYLACQNGFIYKLNFKTKEIENFIQQHEVALIQYA